MKIQVTMKDPDILHDAIEEAIREDLQDSGMAEKMNEDEIEVLVESRKETTIAMCDKWFRYSECLTVEIDTEAETCTVVPVE